MTDRPCDNPFAGEGDWLKTAVHVHTTHSDGAVSPGDALAAYAAAGYDAIAFGDHRRVTCPPSGRMIVIPGAEFDARPPDSPAGFHFMAVGLPAGFDDPMDRHNEDPAALAKTLAGLCRYLVIAHPYWSALTTELIAPLAGLAHGLEVYNHGCHVEDELGLSMYVWDQLLARAARLHGLAVDDAHWRRDDDRFGGWLMVRSPERSVEAVLSAMKAGRFYATMGPEIRRIEQVGPRRFRVETSPAEAILFRCNGSLGDGRQTGRGGPITAAEHDLPDRARFLRVEVTDAAGRKAWSNPFYL